MVDSNKRQPFQWRRRIYVNVLLPSKDKDNYYYDLTTFNVFNVNPTIHRDITYSPFAQDVNLTIQDPAVDM